MLTIKKKIGQVVPLLFRWSKKEVKLKHGIILNLLYLLALIRRTSKVVRVVMTETLAAPPLLRKTN